MDKVVVDPALITHLHNLDSRLELCDESGNTLGYFVPAAEHQRLLYDWARGEFTDEELEKARQESGGKNIADLLADISESN